MTEGPQKALFLLVLQRLTHPPLFNDKAIDQSHKFHNASEKYTTMHHFVTEMCTYVHISVTKWCIMGCDTGALWDLCNRSIAFHSQCSATARDHSGYGLIGINQ